MKSIGPSPRPKSYASGQTVLHSGTYETFHSHPLTREITLLSRQIFPGCPRCMVPVTFAIVSGPAIESASARFRLLMNPPPPLQKRRSLDGR